VQLRRLLYFVLVSVGLGLVYPLAGTPMLADTEAEPAEQAEQVDKPERLTRLRGTASIDRNNNVVGAVVMVWHEEDHSLVYFTSTDEKGVFRLDKMPEGEYQVVVHRDGFSDVVKQGVTLRFPFRAVVELKMEQSDFESVMESANLTEPDPSAAPAAVRGRVLDNAAEPVGEVEIRFVRPFGGVDPRLARTSMDGLFETELPIGPWQIQITGVGYLPIVSIIDVAEETRLEFRLVDQPADYKASPFELMPPEMRSQSGESSKPCPSDTTP